MTNKNLKIIIITFVVLLGLLLIKIYLPENINQESPYLNVINKIDPKNITSIDIEKDKEKIELKNVKNTWLLNEKKADPDKIESLITVLFPVKEPELIARTYKNYKQYDLLKDLATKITINRDLSIYGGKIDGTDFYVRINESPEVYLLKNPSTISSDPNDWYDKKILNIENEKVTKITIKDSSKSLSLVKKDNKWLDQDKKEVTTENVKMFLDSLTNITALSFLAVSQDIYSNEAELTINIDYDNKKEELQFFKGDSDYLVKRNSDKEQLVISDYNMSSLTSIIEEKL